jgi:hypothetical protein
LNWFCSTSGVYRFQVKIERADQPGSGLPTGMQGSKLKQMLNFNPGARYAGLLPTTRFRAATLLAGLALSHFDEAQLTPPVGANFGPGPQFSLTASLVPNVPYNLSVAAMDAQGNAGDSSQVWKFTWVPPPQVDNVPWPARPLPPLTGFYEGPGPTSVRLTALTLNSSITGAIDTRYPVGIIIGQFNLSDSTSIQIVYNVGTTDFASYSFVSTGKVLDPGSFLLKAISPDPARNGQPLLPIVAYRQQVANTNFPHVTGNLVQCSPLLERIAYSLDFHPFNASFITIVDRLIAALPIPACPTCDNYISVLCLRDQQPVIHGATYQYYVVRFNAKREIDEVLPTNPVYVP